LLEFSVRSAYRGVVIGLTPKLATRRFKEPKLWTYDELCEKLPESNQPMELWNGELIIFPSPDVDHQYSIGGLYSAMRAWVLERDLGQVIMAPFDMVLAPRQVVQPDIVFVAKARLGLIKRILRGPADLVVEVLSPRSHNRDRIQKRDLYEQHGIKEYWIIDREAGTVEVFFLTNGEYKLAGRWRAGEKAKSRLLKGFSVAVSEVL
jgi:Uma2 family endonuclease